MERPILHFSPCLGEALPPTFARLTGKSCTDKHSVWQSMIVTFEAKTDRVVRRNPKDTAGRRPVNHSDFLIDRSSYQEGIRTGGFRLWNATFRNLEYLCWDTIYKLTTIWIFSGEFHQEFSNVGMVCGHIQVKTNSRWSPKFGEHTLIQPKTLQII